MERIKSTAPQLCDICQGEFIHTYCKKIQYYTVCKDCIDRSVIQKINSLHGEGY